MAIDANDVIKVVAKMRFNEQDDIINVFGGLFTDLGTALQAELLEYLAAWVELPYIAMNDNLPDNLTYDTVDITNNSKNEAYGAFEWPTLNNGANSGQHMPSSDACYAFARTSTVGHRGGKFWPGMVESANVDGLWDTAFLASYVNATTNWITEATDIGTGADWQPRVISSTLAHQARDLIGGVTRAVVQPMIRRKMGR